MNYVFIKKADHGYDFAKTSGDGLNAPYRKADEFLFDEAEVQSISNGKFIIIYDHMYRQEMTFIKMTLEDELKDVDTLSINALRFGLIFKIKEAVEKCKRLFSNGEEKDKRDRMSGPIIIINGDNMYQILTNFSCEVIDQYYNNNDLSLISTDELLGDVSPKELLMFYVNSLREDSGYVYYPLVFGNTDSGEITIVDAKNNERKASKEDFVCHW